MHIILLTTNHRYDLTWPDQAWPLIRTHDLLCREAEYRVIREKAYNQLDFITSSG